jgi:large subunit ribosomal protein L18
MNCGGWAQPPLSHPAHQGYAMAKRSRQDIRRAIHTRIRKKVRGTAGQPRLAVFRSVKHIYVQIIDDDNGVTLCAASSAEKNAGAKPGGNMAAAQTIGKLIAERAKEKGISNVVFDRGGYIYHGRVKSLADAAREAGLEF